MFDSKTITAFLYQIGKNKNLLSIGMIIAKSNQKIEKKLGIFLWGLYLFHKVNSWSWITKKYKSSIFCLSWNMLVDLMNESFSFCDAYPVDKLFLPFRSYGDWYTYREYTSLRHYPAQDDCVDWGEYRLVRSYTLHYITPIQYQERWREVVLG